MVVVALRHASLELSWDRVRGHRLRRHGLVEPFTANSASQVASTVCGIHTQMGSAAALSLARRVSGADIGLLSQVLWEDRSLVKTYGPRGTVHVFPAEELSLWTAATRAMPAKGFRQPQSGPSLVALTAVQADQLRTAVVAATRGTQLTRAELGAAIAAECGSWVDAIAIPAFGSGWPHWRVAIDEAVADGVLCFGAPQGNRVTFVRSDEWLPDTITQVWSADDDAVLGDAPAVHVEVARRYLASYGPATHQEFGQWLALPAGRAKQVYAALGEELVPVEVEGHRTWALREQDPQSWEPVGDCVRLLGYFDCFAVGSHPRDELAPPEVARRALAHGRSFARGNGRQFLCGPLPVLLIDGVVGGVWTYRQQNRVEQVRVEVFGATNASLRRLLVEEVDRLTALLDRDLELSVGPADIAAHM